MWCNMCMYQTSERYSSSAPCMETSRSTYALRDKHIIYINAMRLMLLACFAWFFSTIHQMHLACRTPRKAVKQRRKQSSRATSQDAWHAYAATCSELSHSHYLPSFGSSIRIGLPWEHRQTLVSRYLPSASKPRQYECRCRKLERTVVDLLECIPYYQASACY